MRLPAFLLAGLLLAFGGSAEAAVVVQYQMGQAQPQTEDAFNVADGGALTSGAGLTGFNLSAANAYPGAPQLQVNPTAAAADATAAYTANSLVSFTLTVGSNVSDLDLTSITIDIGKGGSSGTRGYGLRVTTPTTSDEILKASTVLTAVRPTYQNENIALTGFSDLQNLTAGQVLTFQLAIFTPGSGQSIEVDNITINGNVVTVPEPGTALGLAGVAGLLLRRQRRC